MASISRCAPYCCSQDFLIKLPLLTIETLSKASTCLPNSTSSPDPGLDMKARTLDYSSDGGSIWDIPRYFG